MPDTSDDLDALVSAWADACRAADEAARLERIAASAEATARNELTRAKAAERNAFDALEAYRKKARLNGAT